MVQYMHEYSDETEEMARALVAYARNRIAAAQPLDNVVAAGELDRRAGETVTAGGIGVGGGSAAVGRGARARDDLDRPPRVARLRAGRADQGERAVRPDRGRLVHYRGGLDRRCRRDLGGEPSPRLARDLAGLPAGPGGVFVSGGSAGNLSALVTARHAAA